MSAATFSNQPMFSIGDKLENNFNVTIAIDFGTDGLGVAYAFNDAIYVHDKWKSKKYGSIVKPKTIILLDDEMNTVAVGMDAKHVYMNLTDKERNEWMLFERFKMSLYQHEIHDSDDDEKEDSEFVQIDIQNELIAVNGKRCSSEIVFIAAFKHIKEICKKYLKKRKLKVNDEEIQWIITVPAIWNDAAKHKMKSWAIKSGLIDKNIDNQCKIVYEPDCAALAIQYHMKQINNPNYDKHKKKKKEKNKKSVEKKENNNDNDENKIKEKLEIGDKYILIDAGGGTVDIACHQIIDEFGVKEVHHPSGGKWGSTYIDDQYIKLLQAIFSEEWMNEFKKQAPNIYVEIIHNFQASKSTFYSNPNSNTHNVELPFTFLSFIEEKLAESKWKDEEGQLQDGEYAESFINNTPIYGRKNVISIDEETLEIDVSIWKLMFDHVLDPTINHIKKLLNEANVMRKCKYLCLVGGLSCSPYFQFRMRLTFGPLSKYKLCVIIPFKPILSVIEGAAYFGITKDFVKTRRLKYTYGQIVHLAKTEALWMNVSRDFIEKNEYYHEEAEQYYVSDCFQVIAHKNQEIHLNQVIVMEFERAEAMAGEFHSKILYSNILDPKTMHDGKVLGVARTQFQDDNTAHMEIIFEFHFSDTTFKIFSYPKHAPEDKQEIEIKYQT